MNILIFDTETTSLDKPFCYNIGYVIYDTITDSILLKKEYIIEQIWHNLPLFSTSYYAHKRPIYVNEMRKKTIKMNKYGYVMRDIASDIKNYKVTYAYAYNSPFDDRTISFNCDWFKCNNPFENIPILDIREYAIKFLVDDDYKEFCRNNSYFTDNGNYPTTAEIMYRYVSKNLEFIEDHTALSDSIIENEILKFTLKSGATLGKTYEVKKYIENNEVKEWKIMQNKKELLKVNTSGVVVYKSKNIIKLK